MWGFHSGLGTTAASQFASFALASRLPISLRMMKAGLLSFILLGACVTGDAPPPNNNLGRVCTSTLSVTGSFVRGAAPPLNNDGTTYEGCWPVGTWTFKAAVVQNDCQTAPAMLPQYAFTGSLVVDPMTQDMVQKFTYTTDPTAHATVKVSAAGDATCEGELGVFSPDGKQVWTLKPWLNVDNTITGEGEYDLYGADQWVPPDSN
jgi:hypothetical protein